MSLEAIQRYTDAWAALTPQGPEPIIALTTPDVRFADPFHDIRGHAALRVLLERTRESAQSVEVTLRDAAMGREAGYLRWRFRICRKQGQVFDLEGMSELFFDAEGLVSEHVDHWDSTTQLYLKIPLLGGLINLVRRHIA